MKKIKQVSVAAVAVLAAVSLAACGGGNGTGSGSAGSGDAKHTEVKAADFLKATHEELKDGGELHLSIVELSPQENPFHQDSTGYSHILWYWYNPQIILFDENAKAYPNPEYLESMKGEVKDGKTIVTYKINPKAKYNNGEAVDWKSFETTWKINSGKDKAYSPSSTDGYEHIESVRAGADDHEVIVTFDRVYPWWEGLFNMIANPKLADPEFYKNGYLKNFQSDLGAGPYKVDSADFNRGTAVFVPNEKWWGKKAKLDKVTFTQMEDQANINAFKNGEIDATGISSKDYQAKIKGMTGIDYYSAMLPYNNLLMLNAKSANLTDSKVRHAVFSAIDRQQISDIRFSGVNVPGKDGKLTEPFKEPKPGSFLLFPTQDGYEDNFGAAVEYDPEAANKLLDEAGWKKGDNGIREKDGKKLELRYPLLGDSETFKGIARAYQAMLKKVGIDMKIEEKPTKEFTNIYTKRDFDIFSMAFRSSDPFGVAYFGQIYGSDSGLNLSSTGTPEFDKKIDELQKLPTAEEQIKRGNELEKEAFKLYGIMPLFNGPSLTAVKHNLANMGSMGFATMPKEVIGWKK